MKRFMWFVALATVGFAVYGSGLRIDYYGDDLSFLFHDPASKIGHFFAHPNPFGFYRPLEGAFLAAVQASFGTNTLPIHVTQIFVHALLCWILMAFMMQIGFSRHQAIIGSCFFLVSQTNVIVVLSNDTFSQSVGTFMGVLCLWTLYRAMFDTENSGCKPRPTFKMGNYVISLVLLVFSLLSKETSVSFILLISTLFFVRVRFCGTQGQTLGYGKAVAWLAPFIAVTILYLVVRSLVADSQPALGEGRNDFRIGANIVTNLGLCLAAMASPISTVSVMAALKNHDVARVGIYAVTTIVFVMFVLAGLAINARRHLVILLAFFAICALFPVVVLNHVSEAHVYNSLPFFSILVGAGLGTLAHRIGPAPWKRLAFIALVLVFFGTQYYSAQTKAIMMRNNGQRAVSLIEQIQPFLGQLPHNGELILVNPPGGTFEYSVFVFNGFNVLALGLSRSVERVSGRKDISARIVESAAGIQRQNGRVVLTLSDGVVQAH